MPAWFERTEGRQGRYENGERDALGEAIRMGNIAPSTENLLPPYSVQLAEEEPNPPASPKPKFGTLFGLGASIVWVLFLVVLQIVGAAHAISGFRQKDLAFEQIWCSPVFQLANETFNSECTYFPIIQREDLGVGCVDVTGNQLSWLKAAGFGVTTQLIIELLESVVLFTPKRFLFSAIAKFQQHNHYKAPIVTMFIGVGVWGYLFRVGLDQITELPVDLDSGWLGMNGTEIATCRIFMHSGGLRGTLIAWSDGIFGKSSWYTGD